MKAFEIIIILMPAKMSIKLKEVKEIEMLRNFIGDGSAKNDQNHL
jgi:hypothetical protein